MVVQKLETPIKKYPLGRVPSEIKKPSNRQIHFGKEQSDNHEAVRIPLLQGHRWWIQWLPFAKAYQTGRYCSQ
jgi:hypothetical protein